MRILGTTLVGAQARAVLVDVRILRGQMGRFLLTGLPGAAVKESRERVRAAVSASGWEFPSRSLLVHLAPGDLRKEGPLLDLPIALGVLAATGQLGEGGPRVLAAGELSLDGTLRPVRGAVAIAREARARGVDVLLLPPGSAEPASLVPDLDVRCARTLDEAARFLAGRGELVRPSRPIPPDPPAEGDPFEGIRGQDTAKRALACAAAGRLNVLMVGPPGSGKTQLARRLARLLPPLDDDEWLEVMALHGLLAADGPLLDRRPPFRAPHHTASPAALVGGGPQLRPGEVTLAHRGVLFLDELPEFPRHALEALRQPLEDRVVTISRAYGSFLFPADVVFVAAMNPCPCGFRGDRTHACRCSESRVARYLSRVSGPLLDRIDLVLEVPALPPERLLGNEGERAAPAWTDKIRRAVERQRDRLRRRPERWNGELDSEALDRVGHETPRARELLLLAARKLGLSARALVRARRVARTHADLEDRDEVEPDDVAFALSCRMNFDAT